MDENQAPQAEKAGSNNSMMIVVALIVVLVIGGGAYFFLSKKQATAPAQTQQEQETSQTQTEQEAQVTEPTPESSEAMEAGEVKTFNVDASNFTFSVKEMKVKKGDTVKIVFTNKNGFHDFVLDEFDVRTKQLSTGQTEIVEFVADKAGTFEYYCSVGQHRQNGMSGKLIVE